MSRHESAHLLAGLMTVAGAMHFVRPQPYRSMIPTELGSPAVWVAGSGAAELAWAAGLAIPRTRTAAAWATAAVFVLVFPGNVTMAVRASGKDPRYVAGTCARLPLQLPLVWWAVKVARRDRQRPTTS